jgi:hypothetical protein
MEGGDGNGNQVAPTAGPVEVYAAGNYDANGSPSTVPFLANGNNINSWGLLLNTSGVVPQGYRDTGWLFVQKINQLVYSFTSTPTSSPFVEQPGLDTSYPYQDTNNFTDAPGIALTNTFGNTTFTAVGALSENVQFTVYLMWDPLIPPTGVSSCDGPLSTIDQNGNVAFSPSTCASIPVPMESLVWGFKGNAIKTLNPVQGTASNTWILGCGTGETPTYGPPSFPQWTYTLNAHFFNR